MLNNIVLALVVIVAIAAHYYLYKWVRFKMDEGAVIQYLKETPTDCALDVGQLAQAVELSEKRVTEICRKSKEVAELWKK